MGFPEEIVTFPTMLNVTAEDGNLIQQYQQAIRNSDMAGANAILSNIENYAQKMITAQYLNTITQTCEEIQRFYAEKYNPAYLVQIPEPSGQEIGDFWFAITGVA